MNKKHTTPQIWKYWTTFTMAWHWKTTCNVENPGVCFLLTTINSNLSVSSQKRFLGQVNPQNQAKPVACRGCWCCACNQSIGYWPSPSFLVEDVDKTQAYSSREQSMGIMMIDLNLKIYGFTLAELGWQSLRLFFIRNLGQLLWFKSSRNEWNNIFNEYYIVFFSGG